MLYMIDISGSMAGTVDYPSSRGAASGARPGLAQTDRFGILAFNNEFYEFAAEPLLRPARRISNAARRFVQHLEAGGGTEMLPALQHIDEEARDFPATCAISSCSRTGTLAATKSKILAALRSHLGGARLYNGRHRQLSEFLPGDKDGAIRPAGTFTHIADNGEIREQMGRLLSTIESPCLPT